MFAGELFLRKIAPGRQVRVVYSIFATGAYAQITDDLETLLERKPFRFADFASDYAEVFKQGA
jgi:hypothetical protein